MYIGVTSIQFLNFSQYHQQNVEKRYMKDLCPVYRLGLGHKVRRKTLKPIFLIFNSNHTK